MFTELHQLARAASLLISIAAEGDNLRVTVNATSTSKNGPAVHPLVLVGTPEDIDAGFAEAVQIFEPSALPLLDQARAAADANSNKDKNALKAPKPAAKEAASSTPGKRGPGRPTNAEKAASATAEKKGATTTENPLADTKEDVDTVAPETDPRQMSLVATEGESTNTNADAAPASTDPRDTGLDLPI